MHTIFETDHWAVSHRRDSRYPGFLIVGSKSDVVEISGLSQQALSELGHVLAKTESLLISYFKPYRVITAKLGFSVGHSCHFHVLPASTEFLKEIESHPGYANEPDGNDALLYASREYGERDLTQKECELQNHTIKELREHELTKLGIGLPGRCFAAKSPGSQC